MRLRRRLALTAGAVTLPVMLVLIWYDFHLQHRAAEQMLAGFLASQAPVVRARCEASPSSFGGDLRPGRPPGPPGRPGPPGPPPPGPPPPGPPGSRPRAQPAVVFAYDEALQAPNPRAPLLPEPLLRAIRSSDVAIAPYTWRSPRVEVLLRTPWGTGPCAYLLGRGTTTPEWGSILPEGPIWLLPTAVVLAAMLLAMGPVLHRIRQLTDAVRRSAANSYRSPVHLSGHDEIGELARAFETAAGQIRAQMKARETREQALRHFLANTTHDVMIPLTVLLGHLTTLRERSTAGRPLDPRVLVAAMDEAHYMASLVHNLGLAARLEAEEMQLQPSQVDLGALVGRVVERHRPIAREHGVALDSAVPAAPLLVAVDVTLIEQAVSNITHNAVRYNREGGHVAILLTEGPSGGFVLRVIDDGPGIPAAALGQLLARGARGDEARTRAPEGRGLGLHIAHRAAALHGFQLTLAPSEYGGLEVTLAGGPAAAGGPALAG